MWQRRLVRLWPVVTLAVLAVVFVFMLLFSRKAPLISSLEPAMAAPGDQVTVVGDYFGRTEREGSLSLAGEIPPPSLIQSWSDQRIVFTVPEDATSGLVSVSNSQGTSPGVLFTNTKSIPTVLQAAAAPGAPLIVALSPPQPQAGQRVTLMGRGFGPGDQQPLIRILSEKEVVFEVTAEDCLLWSDRSITFRWPAGAGADASLQVATVRGSTAPFAVAATSPVTFHDRRSLTVEIRAKTTVPAGSPAVVWGSVPQASSGTLWTLDSAQPATVSARPVFRWNGGLAGERQAVYKLTLTTWARNWDGLPAGQVNLTDPPRGDDRPLAWWKAGLSGLKTLTARWGLETPDPWLRLQRLQTGLATFKVKASSAPLGLTRTPGDILTSGTLDSVEASSLAAALAAQSGIPSRLVTGLWADETRLTTRVWTEVWVSGAGWVPWDPVEGAPGPWDNRHFAFETSYSPPDRLEPRAKSFGAPAPWSQGEPAAEAVWSGQEPVVQWEIKRTEK